MTTQAACDKILTNRIARYNELEVMDTQKGHNLPQNVADIIFSRQLLAVIARSDAAGGPFGTKAPIVGAGDMSVVYAVCPSGTGPSLHAHRKTYETFTVLGGCFEFSVGDDGGEKAVLNPFDVVSVPPGVHRAFRNIGTGDGLLQVIVTGGVHDQDDVYFPASTAKEINDQSPDYLAYFKKIGLHFNDQSK